MGTLTQHFDRSEFNCTCCGRYGGTPADLARLADALEAWRGRMGEMAGHEVSIPLNSAYRCPAHNLAVGGEPFSEHMAGRAVDTRPRGISLWQAVLAALEVPELSASGIGLYVNPGNPAGGWIHADVRHSGPVRWGRIILPDRSQKKVPFGEALELARSLAEDAGRLAGKDE